MMRTSGLDERVLLMCAVIGVPLFVVVFLVEGVLVRTIARYGIRSVRFHSGSLAGAER